jgi:hypothetical protein
VIYRVEDGIPVMLPEEGIGTTQLTDFPAACKNLPFRYITRPCHMYDTARFGLSSASLWADQSKRRVISNAANHRGVAMNEASELIKDRQSEPAPGSVQRARWRAAECRPRIANRRLQQWVGNMFEHVDDALFDLAEKAENNAAQMHYFDGMREVRKRRPVVERIFWRHQRELGELTHPKLAEHSPHRRPPITAVELSLVADNELEESLAITSMISKNERACRAICSRSTSGCR